MNLQFLRDFLFTVVLIISLIVCNLTSNQNKKLQQEINQIKFELQDTNEILQQMKKDLDEAKIRKSSQKSEASPAKPQIIHTSYSIENLEAAWSVIVTAYDLSVQSCGKDMDNPGYGVTASGVCLAGHTWDSARAIAVDPDMIPLGSQVMIIFEDEYASQYNGVYTAVDTGGDIDGTRIDLFMGDFQSYEPADEALQFGVRSATIYLI